MSTSGSPKYIYKILPTAPPSPLPQSLPLSDLDRRDGFIHMSTSAQILRTLKAFFTSASSVYILRVQYRNVEPRIKWEMAGGKGPEEKRGCWDTEGRMGGFPHIYHTAEGELRLGSEEVQDGGTWTRDGDTWGQQGWPFKEEDVPQEG